MPAQFASASSSPDEDYGNGLFAFATAWATEGSPSALHATADGIWAADGYGYLRLLTNDGGTARILPNAGPYGCFNANGSIYMGFQLAVSLPGATPLFAGNVIQCDFHPDNRTWAQSRSSQVSVWNLSEFVAVRDFGENFVKVAYSPNGSLLAVGFRDHVEIVDGHDLTARASLGPGPNFTPGSGGVLAWSPDGQKIAYSATTDRLRVYDLAGSLLRTGFGVGDINTIAWSPDGELVAVGDSYDAVRIWNWSNWTSEAREVYLAGSTTTSSGGIGALQFASRDEIDVGVGIGVERWLRVTETVQAIAGPDRTAQVGSTAWFDGSRSRGVIPTGGYRWEIAGPQTTTVMGESASFVPSQVGTYRVVLNVTDEFGHTSQAGFNLTTYPVGDNAPTVTITAPSPGAFVGLPVHVAGTATDDHAVVSVRVQVDTRAPVVATGTTSWSLEFADLPSGYHLLHVVAYDAYQPSAHADLLFGVEVGPTAGGGSPSAEFVFPTNGSEVKGTVTVIGRASGPDIVEWVNFGVVSKGGSFETQAAGTLSWYYRWDSRTSADGWVNLTANATDVNGDWGAATVRVYVNNTGRHETAPPSITITQPAADTKVSPGLIEIRGRVADDGDTAGIQVRIDHGGWHTIPAATEWSLTINASWLVPGGHSIEARVFDAWQGANTTVAVTVELATAPSPASTTSGGNGTLSTAGVAPTALGALVAAVAGASSAVVAWWAGRPKSVKLRAALIAVVVVASGGISFALAGASSSPMSTSLPPGSNPSAPQSPGGPAAPPYEAAAAPGFVCLTEGPALLANDQFLGNPVVLVGTSPPAQGGFIDPRQGQALLEVDRSLSAFPNDTVFIAVDYRVSGNLTQSRENLSRFSAPWQACQGQFWDYSGAPWVAEAPWLIARNGTLAWAPTFGRAGGWQSALPALA